MMKENVDVVVTETIEGKIYDVNGLLIQILAPQDKKFRRRP